MAIASIKKPFSSIRVFNLRRLLSRPTPPPPETATPALITCKEDEFRQVFRFLDADNDGRISADELKAYFASVGDSLSRDEAERMIGEFSRGGGGAGEAPLLEFGEFVRVMELCDDGDVLRRAFGVYEEEKGSGCITAEGLRKALRRLGVVKTVEECKAMIRAYDVDGNGVLDFEEFHKMMA